jgi:hypothetical protein
MEIGFQYKQMFIVKLKFVENNFLISETKSCETILKRTLDRYEGPRENILQG